MYVYVYTYMYHYGGHWNFFCLEFIDFYCYFYNNYTLDLYTFSVLTFTASLGSIFSVYTLVLSPSFKLIVWSE